MEFLLKMLLTSAVLIQHIVEPASRFPRLSLAEEPSKGNYYETSEEYPGIIAFQYHISDDTTGNVQYRSEKRYPNGKVSGAYGYVDPYGVPQRFRYVADEAGYRVFKDPFEPFYEHQTTSPKPIDKVAAEPTESSITWSRPKKPNKKTNNPQNKVGYEKYNNGNRKYNLIGPPSLYVQYD